MCTGSYIHVPVHTLQLELSFLNFKMFYFKIKVHKNATSFDKKTLGNATYISNNLALSERIHGCSSIYKHRSLDLEVNDITTESDKWNRLTPIQRQCCKVQCSYIILLSRMGE